MSLQGDLERTWRTASEGGPYKDWRSGGFIPPPQRRKAAATKGDEERSETDGDGSVAVWGDAGAVSAGRGDDF